MRKIGRRPFLLGSLLVAACGSDTQQPPPSSAPTDLDAGPDTALPPAEPYRTSSLATLPECVDKEPATSLRALVGIWHERPFLPRIYSYTTPEQVAALRGGGPLFSKATTDSGHRGFVFDVLETRKRDGDSEEQRVATELLGTRFELGRFGWPFLAGTRISPERYGNEILSITFRPNSLFVAFSHSGRGFQFFDVAGTPVATNLALASPERIGAFLFMNDTGVSYGSLGPGVSHPGSCNPRSTSLTYREFYLANPSMVSEWSLGTQAIVDRIEAEVADLRALVRGLDCSRGTIGRSCSEVLARWYRLDASRVDKLVASMAFADPFGPAGLHTHDLARLADDLETLRFVPNPYIVST